MDAPTLTGLAVADPPARWEALGFRVSEGVCRVGEVAVRLGAPGRGVTGWDVDGADLTAELPPADVAPGPAEPAASPHPNGVVHLDHVVVTTPDLDRTVGAFEAAGVLLRRTRQAGTPDGPQTQAFFRLGATIAEVVGPTGDAHPGPAHLWGLAFVVEDLDVTAAFLGDRLGPVRPAVQPGRRIASLREGAGSMVPMAFMSAG